MEENDQYACELELKGGYHGRPYPQKFVKAPESQHPSPAPSKGKEVPHGTVMAMVCHAKG